MRAAQRYRWLIIVAVVWIASSLPYISYGATALIVGPLSLPFFPVIAYQRWIGDPIFRQGMHVGMTRAEVRSLAHRLLAMSDRAADNGGEEVRFARSGGFCFEGDDVYVIRFDTLDRVTSWRNVEGGSGC